MTAKAITPLRQRMIEDMNARKLCAGTQRGHIRSCKRFAAFLKRSPDTATIEDIRRFQLHFRMAAVHGAPSAYVEYRKHQPLIGLREFPHLPLARLREPRRCNMFPISRGTAHISSVILSWSPSWNPLAREASCASQCSRRKM